MGLNYSNSNIFSLEYKEANIKQLGYGAIEIVHSNILREVEVALRTSTNKDEFDKYFLGNKFINSIKDISKSELKGISLPKPSEIKIDKINGFLEFDINTLVKDENYRKKFKASVKIKNPFINNNIDSTTDEYNNLHLDDVNNKLEDIKTIENNIDDIVVVYDYKEI
ncbi:MAG: hypothetical protein ACRC3Y_13750 [Romboutsia sp.]|uniref:hypothetical protein n=1 Tax=Romboutsia sp. TaxID=1965302 RepID=UPI003F342924